MSLEVDLVVLATSSFSVLFTERKATEWKEFVPAEVTEVAVIDEQAERKGMDRRTIKIKFFIVVVRLWFV